MPEPSLQEKTGMDRRQSPRVVMELPVKYRPSSGRSENSALLKDVSEDGVGLLLPERQVVGTEFDLEILLSRDTPPLCVRGEAVWQSDSPEHSRGGRFTIGIRFTKVLPSHKSRLMVLLSPPSSYIQSKEWEASFKRYRKLYDPTSVSRKADLLSERLGIPLRHIKGCTYDTHYFKGNIENPIGVIQIPLGIAGPLLIKGKHAVGEFWIPMATTEGALVLTYDLGIRLLRMSGPVETEVISKVVHIDPMFLIRRDEDVRVARFVDEHYQEVKEVAERDSRHTTLLRIERHRVADNLVLKFVYDTADAHGLNMINHATFNACRYIESKTGAFFYHRSHYSGVKHHSLVSEVEGYGRVVRANAVVSKKALDMLKVTASQIEDFGNRCIECGHAAKISSVNVHAANAIAAIFLACGQDAADLTSSTVCASRCEAVSGGKELYVESILRNLLVGTVGGGTGLGTQNECLKIMGCFGSGKSEKFAEIIAAAVVAGEFITAAAVINRTYVNMHDKYGRNKSKHVPSKF